MAALHHSEHSVHSEPLLALRRQAVEQEQDARDADYYESNVNSHNQFPFFLFVNTNPTISAGMAMENAKM